ncbi:methyltransferase domain-containing protein [Bacillus sp. IITD106]|nr:methyltransferase domain-containing protein [Bacillus sp. IITD106]
MPKRYIKKVVLIEQSIYLEFLSKFGVGSAHPGGMDLTKEILESEEINETTNILDVGCGTGQTTAYLASHYGANVTGMDINPIMVEKSRYRMANTQLPVEIIQASIENCPLEKDTFDYIFSESVLAFVSASRALKEIFRLLKSGGRFIANELTLNQQLEAPEQEEIKKFYGFGSFLMEEEWITLLEEIGFKNIQVYKPPYSLTENNSIPEFDYSETIEPRLFMVMMEHFNNMYKYDGVMDFRIFTCTKE